MPSSQRSNLQVENKFWDSHGGASSELSSRGECHKECKQAAASSCSNLGVGRHVWGKDTLSLGSSSMAWVLEPGHFCSAWDSSIENLWARAPQWPGQGSLRAAAWGSFYPVLCSSFSHNVRHTLIGVVYRLTCLLPFPHPFIISRHGP